MTSLAFAPCFNALRFLFPIGIALIFVVTGVGSAPSRLRTRNPDEPGRHAFPCGDNDFLMANILWRISRNLMADIEPLMAIIKRPMADIASTMANIGCLWRISKCLWRKSHRAMAKNILVWRKFSG